MVAGLNLRVNIIREDYATDDRVGGAIITGSVMCQDVYARISAQRPSQESLEQGLEVNRLFDMILVGKGFTVNERDLVEVVWPIDHPYHQEQFRVMGIQLDGRRRQYGHTQYTLSRIERSRRQQ